MVHVEIRLKLPLSMGRKSIEILEKMKDSGGAGGGDAPREFAENELKLPLSMGRKIIEIP